MFKTSLLAAAAAVPMLLSAQARAAVELGINLHESGYTDSSTFGASPLTVAQSFGTFTLTVNTGTNTLLPSIDLSSAQISSGAAGTLVITLSATGFVSPVGLAGWLTAFSGNEPTGSATVSAVTYLDTSNTMFNTSGQGVTELSALSGTPGVFGTSAWASATASAPFALTEVLTVVATGVTGTISTDLQTSAVPEPMTLSLLGSGLIGLGLIRRRGA